MVLLKTISDLNLAVGAANAALAVACLILKTNDWRMRLWCLGLFASGCVDIIMSVALRGVPNQWVNQIMTPLLALGLWGPLAGWTRHGGTRKIAYTCISSYCIAWAWLALYGAESWKTYGAVSKPLGCVAALGVSIAFLLDRSANPYPICRSPRVWFGATILSAALIQLIPYVVLPHLPRDQQITLWLSRNALLALANGCSGMGLLYALKA